MLHKFKKKDKSIFDCKAVFEPGDYLYFYGDFLTKERTEKEVKFLIPVIHEG